MSFQLAGQGETLCMHNKYINKNKTNKGNKVQLIKRELKARDYHLILSDKLIKDECKTLKMSQLITR